VEKLLRELARGTLLTKLNNVVSEITVSGSSNTGGRVLGVGGRKCGMME
jgi:hypothetical protein